MGIIASVTKRECSLLQPFSIDWLPSQHQCDQIWQNFANRVRFLKSLAKFQVLNLYWAIFEPTLALKKCYCAIFLL